MRLVKELATLALVVGLTVGYTLWASNFADYMHLEDLGLEESEASVALRLVSPGERILLGASLTLMVIGLVAWLIVGLIWLKNRPERFDKVIRS